MAESSNDKENGAPTLLIHHPDDVYIHPGLPYAPPYTGEPTTDPWNGENLYNTEQPVFGPDVGLATYTGRDLTIDNLPLNISMIFHPKTTKVRVVV